MVLWLFHCFLPFVNTDKVARFLIRTHVPEVEVDRGIDSLGAASEVAGLAPRFLPQFVLQFKHFLSSVFVIRTVHYVLVLLDDCDEVCVFAVSMPLRIASMDQVEDRGRGDRCRWQDADFEDEEHRHRDRLRSHALAGRRDRRRGGA